MELLASVAMVSPPHHDLRLQRSGFWNEQQLLINVFCSPENDTSYKPAAQHKFDTDLCQNGVGHGCDLDSWYCGKRPRVIFLVVPICGFEQPSR